MITWANGAEAAQRVLLPGRATESVSLLGGGCALLEAGGVWCWRRDDPHVTEIALIE